MKVKFWCGNEQEIFELSDEMTEQEVIDHFHEWLEQKADAGFDLIEGRYSDSDEDSDSEIRIEKLKEIYLEELL